MQMKPFPEGVDLLKDEILSSVVRRLSRKYGRTSPNFCSLLSSRGFNCARDLDLIFDESLIKDLANATGIPFKKLKAMQLISLEGKLYKVYDKTKQLSPSFHVCRTVTKMILYGQQLCCDCLREDVEPYFRKKWRLAFVVGCIRHSVALVDRCPDCGVEIRIAKQTALQKITVCRSCGFDFLQYRHQVVIDANILSLQKKLMAVLSTGEFEIEKGLKIPSYDLFALVQQMFKLCCLYNKTEQLRAYFSEKGVKMYSEDLVCQGYVELLSPLQRATMMAILANLFGDWPSRFVEMCDQNRINSSHLFQKGRCAPEYFFHLMEANNLWRFSGDSKKFFICTNATPKAAVRRNPNGN